MFVKIKEGVRGGFKISLLQQSKKYNMTGNYSANSKFDIL